MVKLKVKARIIPENVYLSQVEFPSSAAAAASARGERRLQVVVHDPEKWFIGTLANAIKDKFLSLYKCDIGEIKYLKDNEDDCDLDPAEKVSDLLVDEGRALTDQSDQQVIVKVIQEQGRAIREGSLVPDLTPAQYQLPRPPVPRFEQIEPLLGKRKAAAADDINGDIRDTIETGRKRSRLSEIEEDTAIPSIERDRVSSVVIHDSQPTPNTVRPHGARSPEFGWSFDRIGPPTTIAQEEVSEQNQGQKRLRSARRTDAPTPKPNLQKVTSGIDNSSASKKFMTRLRDKFDRLDSDIDDSQMSPRSRSTSKITPRLVRSEDKRKSATSDGGGKNSTNGIGMNGDDLDNDTPGLDKEASSRQSSDSSLERSHYEDAQAGSYSLPPPRQATPKASGAAEQQEPNDTTILDQPLSVPATTEATPPLQKSKKRKASGSPIDHNTSITGTNSTNAAPSRQAQMSISAGPAEKQTKRSRGRASLQTDSSKEATPARSATDTNSVEAEVSKATPLKPVNASRKKRPDSMTLDSPSEQLTQTLQESARTTTAKSPKHVETTPSAKTKGVAKSKGTSNGIDPPAKSNPISQVNTKSAAIELATKALLTKTTQPATKPAEKTKLQPDNSSSDKTAPTPPASKPRTVRIDESSAAKQPPTEPPQSQSNPQSKPHDSPSTAAAAPSSTITTSAPQPPTTHSVILPPGMTQEEFDRIVSNFDPTIQPTKRSKKSTTNTAAATASLNKSTSRDSDVPKSGPTPGRSTSEAPSARSTSAAKADVSMNPPKTPNRTGGKRSGSVLSSSSAATAVVPQLQTPTTSRKARETSRDEAKGSAKETATESIKQQGTQEKGTNKDKVKKGTGPSVAPSSSSTAETPSSVRSSSKPPPPPLQTTKPTSTSTAKKAAAQTKTPPPAKKKDKDDSNFSSDESSPSPSHVTPSSKDKENQPVTHATKAASSVSSGSKSTSNAEENKTKTPSSVASSSASKPKSALKKTQAPTTPQASTSSSLPAANIPAAAVTPTTTTTTTSKPKPSNPKFKLPTQINNTTTTTTTTSRPPSNPLQQATTSTAPFKPTSSFTNPASVLSQARNLKIPLKELHRMVTESAANSPLNTPIASTPGSISGRRGTGGSTSFLAAGGGGGGGKGILGVDDDDEDEESSDDSESD